MVSQVRQNFDGNILGTQGLPGACWGDESQLLSTIQRHLSHDAPAQHKWGKEACLGQSWKEKCLYKLPVKQLLGTKTFRIYFSFGDALVRLAIACLFSWRGTWSSCLQGEGCRTWCTWWIWCFWGISNTADGCHLVPQQGDKFHCGPSVLVFIARCFHWRMTPSFHTSLAVRGGDSFGTIYPITFQKCRLE